MGEESIRQDKGLARAAIKGLTAYAEQIAHQEKMMKYSRSGAWLTH